MSTVGLNETTIQKNIRDQEKHDIVQYKLTRVETHAPLRVLTV